MTSCRSHRTLLFTLAAVMVLVGRTGAAVMGAEFEQQVPQRTAGEIAELRAAAEQCDAAAQFELGGLYSDGRGVERDDAEAVGLIRQAAEQGHDEAQYVLGMLSTR